MREYMELGATPCDEDCAQVGTDDYYTRASKESKAYIKQLWRQLVKEKGITPDNAPVAFRLTMKSYPHDFGTYHEVVASYLDGDEASTDLAWYLENNSPANWDEEAKKELKE